MGVRKMGKGCMGRGKMGERRWKGESFESMHADLHADLLSKGIREETFGLNVWEPCPMCLSFKNGMLFSYGFVFPWKRLSWDLLNM
jgi:hypothetical protein